MKQKILIVSFLIVLSITFDGCEFYGNKDLGNKFTLFARDNPESHFDIIYCSKYDIGGCITGVTILPQGDDKYYKYIETAKSNEKWVIAKSILIKDKTEQFWIIDKNFSLDSKYQNWPLSEKDGIAFTQFIQSKVQGPFGIEEFNKKLYELKIRITFY
jgi:hypothetical protein